LELSSLNPAIPNRCTVQFVLKNGSMAALANLRDDELLRLLTDGDEQAFATLYQRRQGAVYRFALQMSGSPAVAEEVTQEVFMILLREAKAYDPRRGPLASYLYGMTRRLVWRHLERNPQHQSLGTDEADADDLAVPEQLISRSETQQDLERGEVIQSVRQAILTLPAGYREAVVLCEFHELSYEDAARILGCAVGTVRSRLHRARALLAERLGAKKSSSTKCPA